MAYQVAVAHKDNFIAIYNTFSSIRKVKVVLIFLGNDMHGYNYTGIRYESVLTTMNVRKK